MADPPHAPDDASPFRRFPWGQLAFFIACLTMAAWTWMRYSYAWHPDTLRKFGLGPSSVSEGRFPSDAYCQLLIPDETGHSSRRYMVRVKVFAKPEVAGPKYELVCYQAKSRFTGASVAGLAVGAMGCFVFGLYLKRWLWERRAAA